MYRRRRYGRYRRTRGYGWRGGIRGAYGGKKNGRIAKLTKDVALLKRAQEYKFVLASLQTVLPIVTTGINNTLPRYLPANIDSGDTQEERDGVKILAKSLQLRILVANNRGTPTDNVVRLIVFKQNKVIRDTSLPTTGDILENDDHVMSLYNATSKLINWTKLLDETIVFDTELHTQKTFNVYWKFNDTITFDNPTGSEGNTQGTRYYITALSQTLQTSSANAPGISYEGRLRYLDS